MNRAGWKLHAVFLGADVGGELDIITATGKLLSECRGGKEMPASASSSEQNQAATQAACSLMPVRSWSDSVATLTVTRPAIGRLRVSPSAKPMVSAMASREVPP